MGEQKNLFLAIGISIVIILVFQFLFPPQPIVSNTNEQLGVSKKTNNLSSIDENETSSKTVIKSKDEIISASKRISISTPSLSGSINTKGAILDDLTLLKYNDSLDEDSQNITLFSPEGTANPYFFEISY